MTPSGNNESNNNEDAAPLLANKALLSQDSIPDENQQNSCFSCNEALTGLFCQSCGQKNDNYRRSIFSLLIEAFASIFSLENRMWRTWAKLFFKPGKVAREFADGKRTNWTSPVRMYLALSIILFGYMGLTETRVFSIRTDIVPAEGYTGPVENLPDASVELKPDFRVFRRQAEIDKLNSKVDFDRVSRLISGPPRHILIFDMDLKNLGIMPSDELLMSSNSWPGVTEGEDVNLQTRKAREQAVITYTQKVDTSVKAYNQLLATLVNGERISNRLFQLKDKSTFELKEIENLDEKTMISQSELQKNLTLLGLSMRDLHQLPMETQTSFNLGTGQINGVKLSQSDVQNLAERVLRNPAILNDGLSKYLPRIMFLMMPFAALIGLIFIRGKKTALLYDHLVHATYIHAVTFAFILLLILLSQWTPMIGIPQIFIIGIVIYLPLSAKNMFGRGWVKTIFSSYGIAGLYAITILIVVILLAAGSIVEAFKAGQV